MTAIVGVALPAAAALAWAWRSAAAAGTRTLLAVVSFPVLLGAAAIPWSLLMFAGVRSAAVLVAADVVFFAAFAAATPALARRQEDVATSERGARPLATGAAALLLAVVASIAAASFIAGTTVFPHGEWDAWAQWNLRARFFFRGLADGSWHAAFDPVLAWSHADYPPLLPAAVARIWTYAGIEATAVPTALAAIFATSIAVVAALSVARARGAARGCLAAAAILATPSFVRWAPSQEADIVIAFYMLAAFVLWQEERWMLAGLAAGLAAWTKNEGLAFLVLFLAIAAVAAIRAGRLPALARLVAGAIPAMLAIAWFKHAVAPPSYFVVGQTVSQMLARVADPGRAQFVARALGRELWLNGGSLVGVLPIVAAFGAIRGIRRDASTAARWGAVAVVAMAGVYFAAYLATPLDVAWQVQTSMDRLVLQVVPLAVWAVLSFAA